MNQRRFDLQILKELDIDGAPFGTNIVLTGPPGVGKSVFCETLIGECLKEEVNVIYATLDTAPKDIRDRVLGQGTKQLDERKGLIFIDGYSWLLGEETERYHVSHLSNLSDLSVKIFNTLNELGGHDIVIFDSISTLFVYNSENEITRFIQVNMARIKQRDSVGFWTVEEGIHDPSFYNSLRHLAEGVIEMRFEDAHELKRFIRVHTFKGIAHNTNWFSFTITDNGEFVVK